MATKIRRSLFIGLGGTGMNALLHTKKMYYDTYGEVPPMIGFLGLDTDGGVYNRSIPAADGTPVSLSTSEQLPITVGSPQQIYLRNPENYDWMPEPNVGALSALNIGAGQTRSNGRFAVTLHKDDLAGRVQNKILQINNAAHIDNPGYSLLSNDLEVHVVFSLSGGTGCGTFLNVAYLLRELLPDAKISGYAVMADVFRAMMQGAGVVRVRPNAFGAIMDLDFLAHLDAASAPVTFKWLRDAQIVRERPFTALYLIDNRNANGDMFNDVDQLCEMISLALVTSTGELSVAAASVSDNVAKVIGDGSMDIRNKKAWAAGFGVSEIVYNGRALAEIYEHKARIQLVNRMLNGGCDDPSVIANAWIDDTRIRENLGKDDVIDYFMKPTPQFDFTDIDNPDAPLPNCETYLNNRAVDPQEQLNEKLDALKTRVRASLRDLIRGVLDRECGVFLAQNVLGAIRTQIDMCSAEMKAETQNLKAELPRRRAAMETACSELADCMGTWFKRGKSEYMEEVCGTVRRLAVLMREIKRRELAREFYATLDSMLAESYRRVDIIASNLSAVREQSNRAVEGIRQTIGAVSFFQFDLAVGEVEKVACDPSDVSLNDFVLRVVKPMGGVAAIADMTIDETAAAMAGYTSGLAAVAGYASRSVDDVMRSMPETELRPLLQRAISKSLPLFTYNYHGYDADVKVPPMDAFYVGVADDKTTWLRHGDMFQELVPNGSKVDFSGIGIKDRVIIYRQVGVLPAFTISALDVYKPEYDRFETDKPGTSHWDAGVRARMEAERFSLMPTDVVKEQNVLSMWVMALLYGLIGYADGHYSIKSRGLGGKPLGGFKVDMGATRKEAYDFFRANVDLLKPELEAHIATLDVPGPDNMIRKTNARAKAEAADGSYLGGLSLCPIPASDIEFYPDEAELLNREMEYILGM